MELRPKRHGGYKDKGKANNVVVVLQDVVSNSSYESNVSFVGVQGKDKGMSLSHHANTSASVQYSSSQDDKKQGEIFHVRVIMKHTKVDFLFDSGLQLNLVSKEVVNKLGLPNIPHEKTYPLGWVNNDA